MRKDFLPFSRPSIGEREIAAVAETLRSGWISSGPRVEELEAAFARAAGARGAVALSSATAGFHLLYHALGIGPGDEVVTASLTWPSPVNQIVLRGARPVFADVDAGTWQLDPAGVEAAITARTRAVVPVHFAGQAADLDRLRAICTHHRLVLIEDAAHAAGGAYRGRPIGSGGNPAVFSLHATKSITCGEGGVVTSDDEALLARLRLLRFHGVDRDAWKRHAAAPGGYDLEEPGWKYNLTDIQAALALPQLERLEEIVARREALARRYDELLAGIAGLECMALAPYCSRHARHLYTVLIDRERCRLDRDGFRDALRRRNIGTGLHYPAVHQLAYYQRQFPIAPGALPQTERVAAGIVSLPLFAELREEDVREVAEAVRETLSCS
jgi:UDP-4-amino-4-deoxy-L-arabinose-oxoglutarate aminotransferase